MPINITSSVKWRRRTKRVNPILLPGDSAIIKQIAAEKASKKAAINEAAEELVRTKVFDLPRVQRETGDLSVQEVLSCIKRLHEIQWNDYPEKGVSHAVMAAADKFRREVPKLVLVSQLYGIFKLKTTALDKVVAELCRDGAYRLLITNLNGKSETSVLIESSAYYSAFKDTPQEIVLKNYLQENNSLTWVTENDLQERGLTRPDVRTLVARGLLSLIPGSPGLLHVASPSLGIFMKLVLDCRRWLAKTLSQNKWRELPETTIESKLAHSTQYWKQLHGITLEWILYDGVGAGYLEMFGTPVGRGWKLLRSP